MTTSLPTDEPIVELDLRDLPARLRSRRERSFDQDHVLEWLRTSGGTLTEREMKAAAAELIEARRAAAG